jgi:Protein of unknown function (DUF3105)
MAKKSRTPRPPRPVQAPKRRTESRSGPPRRLLTIVLATVVVAAILGVGIALAVRGGGSDTAASSGSGVCGRVQTFPQQPRTHVLKLPKGFKYNSFPPTSGPHNPTPAIWNLYTEPVPELNLVHNLEHGGIIVQYGSRVPASTVDKITEWYRESPNALIVAPLPKLGNKVAVTSWQHLMMCSGFDEKTFTGFRTAHRYNAPEKFPPASLQPGS